MTSVKTDAASLSETGPGAGLVRGAGRDLPWRATRDPYRVLVAEVLAQQTQAARAAEAWPRFLERFPDVGALAAAAPAEVLRACLGPRLQPAGAGPAPDGSGGGGRLAGHGRAGLPSPASAVYGEGGGLLRPRTTGRPSRRNVARVWPVLARPTRPAHFGRPPAPSPTRPMAPEQPWAWSSALMDVGALHCPAQAALRRLPLEATCRWQALGPAAPPARP